MREMNIMIMIISLLMLLCCSAFFSGSETALMAISRLRLRYLAETRLKRTKIIEHILKRPEKLIGTILLGNNLVNVAMSALATALAISIWGQKGIVYVTVVLTLIILIFSEITPKVYAKYFNEKVSFIVAPMIKVLMKVLNPVVFSVTFVSNKILYLIGVDVTKIKKPLITEAELKIFIKAGKDAGAITQEEKQILSRVFTLNDRTVEEVMVTREKMTILDMDAPRKEILKTVFKTRYSRFPVRREKYSDIVGFIHVKDLLKLIINNKPFSLRKILRPAYFVSVDKKIDTQLRGFQIKKYHQAVVLNREGEVAGLITLEDILEELVGSIRDEHDIS